MLSSAARRSLNRLPAKIFEAVAAFIAGPLAATPHRVGKQLGKEFAGLHSARVGAYRVLYEIREEVRVVAVIRIAHRADVHG